MALVTHKFKLDLTPGASRQVLYTSQGDIGRPFEADLYWNGSPWTATGTTASIRGKKPDDTVFDYTATVSGTAVTFETTEQMTIISGPVECELVFSNDGDVIASANFVLMVEDSPYDPDAPSESVIPGIVDLIEDTIGGDVRDEVQAELEAHPEWTTTVQDGAITKAKINTAFLPEIENAYVTPEMFGAKGDGMTDDTLSLQQAIEYVEQHKGVLTLSQKKYKITQPLIVRKPIKIYGYSPKGDTTDNLVYGSEIEQTTNNTSIFTFDNGNFYGIIFKDFRMKGVGGVAIDTTNAAFFSEFEFENLHFNGGFSTALILDDCTDGKIEHCDFSANNIGINLKDVYTIWVEHCNFWQNSDAHLKIETATDVNFYYNWFEKADDVGYGVICQSPVRINSVSFDGCAFVNNNISCIYIDGITNITDIVAVRELAFKNCRFQSANTQAIKVKMKNAENVTNSTVGNSITIMFTDCRFTNQSQYAINTDYKWIFANIINCFCYSGYDSGALPFTDNNIDTVVVTCNTKRGYTTDGYIELEPLADVTLLPANLKNAIYTSPYDNKLRMKNADGVAYEIAPIIAVSTSNRPANPTIGTMVYDTTIGRPIWYTGSGRYIDAVGNQV